MEEEKVAFVIMPFSKTTSEHTEEYWTNHFKEFLKPTIEKMGLRAERSDELRGNILTQIITKLVASYIVVADLTDLNPNVFWELGVRQSFEHRTITIAQIGIQLPFDIGHKNTLFYYPHDHIKMAEFGRNLEQTLRDCLEKPDKPDSQVLEVLGGRGTMFQIFHADETKRRLDALGRELDSNRLCLARLQEPELLAHLEKGDKLFPFAERFDTPALQLLVTDCYLDEDEDFYSLAESCLSLVQFIAGAYSNKSKIERDAITQILEEDCTLAIAREWVEDLIAKIGNITGSVYY